MNNVRCIFIPLSIMAMPVLAENNVEDTQNNITELSEQSNDTITVRSAPTSQSMGTQIINADQIGKYPTGNGTISELLEHNPNVRFANDNNSSLNPGEIAPENVSFHGEKFYNNNFMIDGLSNNNTINPGNKNGSLTTDPDGYSPTDLPSGGTQSFWINSELVDQLQVFDSNVAAKYGDFTGGVVDARLKDPSLDRAAGKISWRTTRDSWTRYHIDEAKQESFVAASQFYYQPKFTKNFYSVTVNQPLNDNAGFVFAYNRQESVIPTYQSTMDTWVNQKRLAETYLLKGTWFADNGDILRLTGMYSPHKSTYYKSDVKEGGFSNNGGGYRGNIEWEHYAPWGKITSLAGYQFEQNKIEQESNNLRTWYRYNTSQNFESQAITWGSGEANANFQRGIIGGYGTFGTDKATTTFKQDAEFTPFEALGVTHQLDAGWQTDFYQARYRRFSDVAVGAGVATIDTTVSCQSGDDFCIDGEQYFKRRTLYPTRTVEGSYTNYAAYLQDSMIYKRLELTPGVRLQYDDYLKNLTIAPRFAGSLDVFGDKHTRIFGGANRYYGQNLLTYKLRTGISANIAQTRTDANSPWVGDTVKYSSYDYDVSDLKTPYSDELSLGLSQRVLDTVWTVKWVNRKGRDQFGRDKSVNDEGRKVYVLSNNAKTEGNTWSLSAQPIGPYHFAMADVSWELGASIVKNKSSSQAYYDQSSTDDNMVIFNGKLLEKGDMDALDFNTPWSAFANINTYFPALNLNWSQNIKYTAGYRGYTTSTVTCPGSHSACGNYEGSATLYEKTKYSDYFTYDWRFTWTQPTFNDQSLELTLDVLNVLDNVIEASQTSSSGSTQVLTYKTGRQFWFGMAYSW
ncbi:TonB-dependent receptor [Klebsiella indica]|uniref:TonB-dependent receptor n=1 Tax=Klebsiella indica TaxID=2582917 RepID=A0A5R9LPI7_9ENTR|nr:TonB-dependent receptor plug domain-containing protein [Klebsiella indica]TLV23958.1 TonB-dependent receptor [Klebsiella indica]